LERTMICGDRFFKVALSGQGVAEVKMVVRTRRIQSDGFANQIYSEVVAADLVGDDAEQMQRLGVFWLRRQDLAVERFGLRQPPSLVVLEREFEGLRDRHGGRMEDGGWRMEDGKWKMGQDA
jgi:hypothetical protein